MKLIAIIMSLFLATTSFAMGTFKVSSGECKLDANEIIQIKNLDSLSHYGMFARGVSSKDDEIYLTENFYYSHNSVDITIRNNVGWSHSIVDLATSGSTHVRASLWVKRSATEGEWITCNLEVSETK